MESLIEVKNLTFFYDLSERVIPVIKNISFTVSRGEFVVVVGPNGCGKSTLVRHLNGLLSPGEGNVIIDGLDTMDEKHLASIRRKVGMVFQNPDTQLFASVVEEDVAFGVENLCLPEAEIKERVSSALSQVEMSGYRLYPPHRLSGGQKQKVAIAGILAMRPECIILDEPTSMLDPKGKTEVLEAVRELNVNHCITVVYVTHDMTEALLGDRLIALAKGELVYDGNPLDFFNNERFLNKAELQAPPIIELVNQLIVAGVELKENIRNPEELVAALCR